MKGYLKNGQATEEAFAGGWFHSGDLGVLHPDGYIQLKDRSKDIIISGGENISSIEVEDVLYKHPAVAAAAVVAKADAKWGETPCAFVELRPGASATEQEIIAWCREQPRPLQMPAPRRVRRSAQDLDRQDPEIQAARPGEGRLTPCRCCVSISSRAAARRSSRLCSTRRIAPCWRLSPCPSATAIRSSPSILPRT